MHSERLKIIAKLIELHDSPNKELEKRSKLTYPTVINFMKGRLVKRCNEENLLKISLDIIDERQQEQLDLLKRSKRLLEKQPSEITPSKSA